MIQYFFFHILDIIDISQRVFFKPHKHFWSFQCAWCGGVKSLQHTPLSHLQNISLLYSSTLGWYCVTFKFFHSDSVLSKIGFPSFFTKSHDITIVDWVQLLLFSKKQFAFPEPLLVLNGGSLCPRKCLIHFLIGQLHIAMIIKFDETKKVVFYHNNIHQEILLCKNLLQNQGCDFWRYDAPCLPDRWCMT